MDNQLTSHPAWFGGGIQQVSVSVKMAVGDPFPEWRETFAGNIRGDNDPLNQGIVATTRLRPVVAALENALREVHEGELDPSVAV